MARNVTPNPPLPDVTDEVQRRVAVEMGFANNRLEGQSPTAEDIVWAERYIAGEVTLDQLIAATVEGIHADSE